MSNTILFVSLAVLFSFASAQWGTTGTTGVGGTTGTGPCTCNCSSCPPPPPPPPGPCCGFEIAMLSTQAARQVLNNGSPTTILLFPLGISPVQRTFNDTTVFNGTYTAPF